MLTIKNVSEIMNISTYTLRFYENKGLFPFVKRDSNNVRIFTKADLEWVYVVQCLRDTGLPLATIRHYIEMCLEGEQTIPDRLELLKKQKQAIEKHKREIEEMTAMVDYKIVSYQNRLDNKTDRIFNPFEEKLKKSEGLK